MKRLLVIALLAAAVSLLGTAAPAQVEKRAALAIIFQPLPERVASSDVVVVGKVTAIEDKTVMAEAFPGSPEKAEFQIGSIKIEDGILGVKNLTHVKVGFIKPMEVQPGKPIIRPGGYGPPKLTIDQEGIFFLQKHPGESFYTMQNANSFITKPNNDNFDKELERVKECAKLLADAKANLKSKKAEERELTAAMLVCRYRPFRGPDAKSEPIDAEESKLILTALAEANWAPKGGPGGPAFNDLNPQSAFMRLGVTEKDGFKPPQFVPGQPPPPPNAYEDAAKKWLKDNAGTYRIQRIVTEKSEKKDEKKEK
jgi:hypothetical protein